LEQCIFRREFEFATQLRNVHVNGASFEISRLETPNVLKDFFDEHGALKPPATREQMESGFMYAAGYGHMDTVRFLLEKGIDPGVHNTHGQTALHWSTYGPHLEIARLLLAQRPSLIAARETAFDGTPLDWALYAWCNAAGAAHREREYEMVALLIDAGARPDGRWLVPRAAEKLHADPKMRQLLGGA